MGIVIIVDREVLGNYFLMEQTEGEVKGNKKFKEMARSWMFSSPYSLSSLPSFLPSFLLSILLSSLFLFFPSLFLCFFSNSLANLDSFCNMDLEENYRWESWCCGIIHFSSTVFLFIIPLSAKIKYNVL